MIAKCLGQSLGFDSPAFLAPLAHFALGQAINSLHFLTHYLQIVINDLFEGPFDCKAPLFCCNYVSRYLATSEGVVS